MYLISYQIDGIQYEQTFETEREMQEYYNIWVSGEDYDFCIFFDPCYEIFPDWA